MVLFECRGADLPLGIERRRQRQFDSGALRTARSPVTRLSPSAIFGRSMVAPWCWRRCVACRELVQGLDGILRLWWTRAIGRRSVLRQAHMVLLRGVEGVDGGQRGLALVGGRAVGWLSLGGCVLVGRHGGRMGGWADELQVLLRAHCWLAAARAALVLRSGRLLSRCGGGGEGEV